MRDGGDGRLLTELTEKKKNGEHKRANSDPMWLVKTQLDNISFQKILESEPNSFSKNSLSNKVPCSQGDEPDVDETGWEEFNSSI